jgi:hypothetical protein
MEGPDLKKVYYLGLLFLLFIGIFISYKKSAEAEHGMKVIIDRFERDFAVVELPDKSTVNMPIKLLEPDAKEGYIIEIKTLRHETEKRQNKVQDLMNDLFE